MKVNCLHNINYRVQSYGGTPDKSGPHKVKGLNSVLNEASGPCWWLSSVSIAQSGYSIFLLYILDVILVHHRVILFFLFLFYRFAMIKAGGHTNQEH